MYTGASRCAARNHLAMSSSSTPGVVVFHHCSMLPSCIHSSGGRINLASQKRCPHTVSWRATCSWENLHVCTAYAEHQMALCMLGQQSSGHAFLSGAPRPEAAAARRAGEAPSTGLTEVLTGLGFETDRLKTGTPARVDSRTVNFANLEAQPGDPDVRWFSFDRSVSPPSLHHTHLV